MTKDILVIGGDTELYQGIKRNLADESVKVYQITSVQEAIWKMQTHSYCLIILDVLLADGMGQEIISIIRQMNPVPILALSEDASIANKVLALKNGADDFLQKPYDLEECLARAQALLRRYTELNHISERNYAVVSHEGLLLDTGRRLLSINGKEISLTPKEYGILLYLLKNRRQIMTYEQIYEAVWKDMYLNDRDTVFYHVGQLRRKIGAKWVESVYGVGYRLREIMG